MLHAIADRVVDEYLEVVQAAEDDVDEIETAVFSPGEKVGIEQIYLFKREILELRRATAPLAAPLHRMAENPNPFIPAHVRAYFRDVEDHLSQVTERVSTYDELLTTLVNAALAEISMQQNSDMRKISAWAAIALVPTAVAGIYGMNFDHMPELSWTFGYPMAMGIIVQHLPAAVPGRCASAAGSERAGSDPGHDQPRWPSSILASSVRACSAVCGLQSTS